jgi:hypothetical protein
VYAGVWGGGDVIQASLCCAVHTRARSHTHTHTRYPQSNTILTAMECCQNAKRHELRASVPVMVPFEFATMLSSVPCVMPTLCIVSWRVTASPEDYMS